MTRLRTKVNPLLTPLELLKMGPTMKKKVHDPVVAEICRARHEISAEHGHDASRLVGHYIRLQEEMKKTGKYRFVTGFYAVSEPEVKTDKK
jgi:hypothetical protein